MNCKGTHTPAGTKCPLNSAPSSGTTLGRHPITPKDNLHERNPVRDAFIGNGRKHASHSRARDTPEAFFDNSGLSHCQ